MSEKTSITRVLEVGANFGIVIVALLCLVVAIKNFSDRNGSLNHNIPVGTKIQVDDVSWFSHRGNLVLALSTTCHFCAESTPFYRDLVAKCSKNHVQTIAVFPQPVAEASSYLEKNKVHVDRIVSMSLARAQISGTPTLILVDENGKVQDVWVGKLSSEREKEVFSRIAVSKE